MTATDRAFGAPCGRPDSRPPGGGWVDRGRSSVGGSGGSRRRGHPRRRPRPCRRSPDHAGDQRRPHRRARPGPPRRRGRPGSRDRAEAGAGARLAGLRGPRSGRLGAPRPPSGIGLGPGRDRRVHAHLGGTGPEVRDHKGGISGDPQVGALRRVPPQRPQRLGRAPGSTRRHRRDLERHALLHAVVGPLPPDRPAPPRPRGHVADGPAAALGRSGRDSSSSGWRPRCTATAGCSPCPRLRAKRSCPCSGWTPHG